MLAVESERTVLLEVTRGSFSSIHLLVDGLLSGWAEILYGLGMSVVFW